MRDAVNDAHNCAKRYRQKDEIRAEPQPCRADELHVPNAKSLCLIYSVENKADE